MGSTKLKKIDKNRWRKTYPRFRKLPITSYMGDDALVIETHEVPFTDTTKVIFVLKENYSGVPSIFLTPYSDSDDSDLNIWVSKVEIGGTTPPGSRKCAVTIETSTKWTGTVLLQSVKAGS